MTVRDDHYLRRELYERVRTDDSIFDFLQGGSLDGVWYWDLENPNQEWLSPRFKSLFGYEPDEMDHSPDWWQANIHPDDLALVLENFEKHKDDLEHLYDQIVRYRHRSGKTIWVRCRGLIIRDECGRPIRMLGAHTDVTSLKEAEVLLVENDNLYREQVEMLRAAEELALIGHWQFTVTTDTLFWSDQVFRIHGLDPAGPVPNVGRAIEFYHPDDQAMVAQAVENALAHGASFEFEARLVRPNGIVREVASRGHCIVDARGKTEKMFGVFLDITERKATERQIAFLAYHDALTGLANRLRFDEKLEAASNAAHRRGSSIAILLIDLDRFKEVNDVYGHPAGDAYLKAIALRLTTSVRQSDLVARLGGDEFAILLSGLGHEAQAMEIADKVLDAIAEPLCLEECGRRVLNPSGSVGVRYAERGSVLSGVQIMSDADIALYQAKGRGRGQACLYEPAMRKRLDDARSHGDALRLALSRDQLALHWQPILDVRLGRYCGAEALLRWQHPTSGLISPQTFLLSAQDADLIERIDVWVLDAALREMRARSREAVSAGLVAVNIAGERLANAATSKALLDRVQEAGDMAHKLVLEISEDVVLSRNAEQIFVTLSEMRRLGVRIALDDFGTGHATLAHFKRLPVDVVKIDREFVSNLDQRSENTLICQAIIGLAKGLGIQVIAEGVERPQEVEVLREMGCDLVQGYHVARPMPIEELEAQASSLTLAA